LFYSESDEHCPREQCVAESDRTRYPGFLLILRGDRTHRAAQVSAIVF
jgi:hypothetical protein